MQVASRRVMVVCAVSLIGATAGIMLGNFVAGGARPSGADELAAYRQLLDSSGKDAVPEDDPAPLLATRSGPTAYECEGCDAHLYNDMMPGDVAAADTAPLPPYRVEDDAPIARPALSATPLRQDGVPAPVAVPALPSVLAADKPRVAPVPALQDQ